MAQPHLHGADLSFLQDLPLAREAVDFASERHAGQSREADDAEFILHPIEVAALLERSGYPDHVVAAAVLHDVLEDTDTERTDLESQFGPEVADLVALVSDDPASEDEERRKDDLRERVRRAGGFALPVYASDKISKVRELRSLIHAGLDPALAQAKLNGHRRSLEMLENAIPGDRLVDVLRFEIESLERVPPMGSDAPSPRTEKGPA